MIAEGVDVLQTALARDRLGEFQAQAAIAALHADAQTAEQTLPESNQLTRQAARLNAQLRS